MLYAVDLSKFECITLQVKTEYTLIETCDYFYFL